MFPVGGGVHDVYDGETKVDRGEDGVGGEVGEDGVDGEGGVDEVGGEDEVGEGDVGGEDGEIHDI